MTWIMTFNLMVAKKGDLYVSPRVYVNKIQRYIARDAICSSLYLLLLPWREEDEEDDDL